MFKSLLCAFFSTELNKKPLFVSCQGILETLDLVASPKLHPMRTLKKAFLFILQTPSHLTRQKEVEHWLN
jgi:hypothetical protein